MPRNNNNNRARQNGRSRRQPRASNAQHKSQPRVSNTQHPWKCAACGATKAARDFSTNQKSKGTRARCKPCVAESQVQRHQQQPTVGHNAPRAQRQQDVFATLAPTAASQGAPAPTAHFATLAPTTPSPQRDFFATVAPTAAPTAAAPTQRDYFGRRHGDLRASMADFSGMTPAPASPRLSRNPFAAPATPNPLAAPSGFGVTFRRTTPTAPKVAPPSAWVWTNPTTSPQVAPTPPVAGSFTPRYSKGQHVQYQLRQPLGVRWVDVTIAKVIHDPAGAYYVIEDANKTAKHTVESRLRSGAPVVARRQTVTAAPTIAVAPPSVATPPAGSAMAAAPHLCRVPLCAKSHHAMELSSDGSAYVTAQNPHGAFSCDSCRRAFVGARWYCKACSNDHCFACAPCTTAQLVGGAAGSPAPSNVVPAPMPTHRAVLHTVDEPAPLRTVDEWRRIEQGRADAAWMRRRNAAPAQLRPRATRAPRVVPRIRLL